METTRYRERLLPKWWAWLLMIAFVGMLAIAYGAALGARTGWIVGILGGSVALALVLTTVPLIDVEDDSLRVSGAVLPSSSISAVRAVDGAQMRELQGPGADARTFVALRPWAASGGVLVTLDDPEDPHPAWLISSRHPDRLAAAVAATMDR